MDYQAFFRNLTDASSARPSVESVVRQDEARADAASRDTQAVYDGAYRTLLGVRAPERVYGERAEVYEARLQRPLQSKASAPLARMDFLEARAARLADAQREALLADVAQQTRAARTTGALRAVLTEGHAGHRLREWHGAADACWNQFKTPQRFVKSFGNERCF